MEKRSTITWFLFFLGVLLFLEGRAMGHVKDKCRKSNIEIAQEWTGLMPNGIPTYTVEITNTCVTGCIISDIHLNCGKFSSARLINPRIFKRLFYDDCLVNDGKPLLPGHTVSFQYSTTFLQPLSVSSVVCHQFRNGSST